MSAGKTLAAAERWLYSVLSGDATLAAAVGTRIYFESVPQNTAAPYIFITTRPMPDIRGAGGNIIASQFEYVVRAVDETPPGGLTTALVNVAAQLHQVLHGSSGSNADGAVFAIVRDAPFSLPEVDRATNRPWRHLGGIYRMWVQ